MSSKIDHYKNIGRVARQSAIQSGGWRAAKPSDDRWRELMEQKWYPNPWLL